VQVRLVAFPLTGATSITCGGFHCCAGMGDADVVCWGDNSSNALTAFVDAGTAHEVTYATPADPALRGARQISMGDDVACAVSADGSALCWGRDDLRQAGKVTTTNCDYFGTPMLCVPNPTKVAGMGETLQIAAGWLHTCAIERPATPAGALPRVRCWGRAATGELGVDPSTITTKCPDDDAASTMVACTETPTIVPGTDGVTQVAVGLHTSCAVKGGNVLCWGSNETGVLGQGSGTDTLVHATPVLVKDDTDTAISGVAEIAVGPSYACALKDDGSVWCWGSDEAGALGSDAGYAPRAQRVPL
jgi:alpha-tubulin suppressor-like RCC1 family protein